MYPGQNWHETEADKFFREDARSLGYMRDDPRPPGEGRGLWAYYRDNGMIPPERLERVIPQHEITGIDLGRLDCE